MMSYDMKYLFS